VAAKSRFVGVRVEPEQQRKLILLSMQTSEPGNMSAGLRWAIEQVRVSGEVRAELAEAPTGSRPERAMVTA
jgi:hypothetical protein